MARKRYGTPVPPGMRRPRFRLPHFPRSRAEWMATFRRRSAWVRISVVLALGFILTNALGTLLATPARPHYDIPAETVSIGPISFTRLAGWALAVDTVQLDRPAVLYAPQVDPAQPPITITFHMVDISDRYASLVGLSDNKGIGDYDLMSKLVEAWTNEAKLPLPTFEHGTYNTTPNSGIVAVSLVASWKEPLPWRPRLAIPPASVTPIPSSSPVVSPEASPEASPTVAPLNYPVLGPPGSAQLYQVQVFYLPLTNTFNGHTPDGQIYHKMLVATLTYPTSLDPEAQAEVLRGFRLLTDAVFFNA